MVNFSSTAELDHDAADTPAASYRDDPGDGLDTLSDQLCERFAIPHALAVKLAAYMRITIEQQSVSYKAWLFGRVCGMIINSRNAKLAAAGLAFASNLASLNGIKSQREFARQNRLSPAAVSKVTKQWQVVLDLPHSPHMKDPEACANYAAVQSSPRHWRRQKATVSALQKARSDMAPAPALSTTNGKGGSA